MVGTRIYKARLLGCYTGTGLAHLVRIKVDANLAEGFDCICLRIYYAVSVCCAGAVYCCHNGEHVSSREDCIFLTCEQHGWSWV